MPLLLKISVLSLALFSFGTLANSEVTTSKTSPTPQDEVFYGIKNNLEQHLYQLPPRIQGHYGIRMYRMTGDEKYANAALVDLYAVSDSQGFYACNLDKPNFIQSEAEKAISVLGKDPRAKARKKALEPFPDFLFYTDVLLRFSSRIDEFGLTGPCHDKINKNP